MRKMLINFQSQNENMQYKNRQISEILKLIDCIKKDIADLENHLELSFYHSDPENNPSCDNKEKEERLYELIKNGEEFSEPVESDFR